MPLPSPDPAEPAAAQPPFASAFDLLPVPVAWCDRQGRWLGCNPAFADFTGQRADVAGARALPGALADPTESALSLAERLQHGSDADNLLWIGSGTLGQPLAARLSLRSQGAWRIVTFLPQADVPAATPPASAAKIQALMEGMDSGQQLARFGTWTHDLRTGARHWDAQVWLFWGRQPQDGALDLDLAMAAIHPDDRDETIAMHRRSLAEPGRFAIRFRVRDPAGVEHRIRTL
jgi:hypothetical protein